jgi:hypothetical protein
VMMSDGGIINEVEYYDGVHVCVEYKHYIDAVSCAKTKSKSKVMINVVTGQCSGGSVVYCSPRFSRQNNGLCGLEGKWFEER